MKDSIFRKTIARDSTFIEGLKGSGEHIHYSSHGGSDLPVNWRNEVTGEGVNLRNTSLRDLQRLGLIK